MQDMIDISIIKERYAQMSDDELIHLLKTEGREITESAFEALKQEFQARHLDISSFDSVEAAKSLKLSETIAMAKESVSNDFQSSLWTYAFDMKRNGKSDEEIFSGLLGKGVDEEHSSLMIKTLESKITEVIASCDTEVRYGIFIFAAGLIITYLTYSLAANGGTYVVAWGAIVFGAVRFFRGLSHKDKYQAVLTNIQAERESNTSIS